MQNFPHRYVVDAAAAEDGDVTLDALGLPRIRSASPREFDGPGDRWSPETLLVGAAADCFILTFRAIARASRLPWTQIRCEAAGTLDRIDRMTAFTRLDLHASLQVPAGTNEEQARRVLEKAERNCLISNSLRAAVHLKADVSVAESEPVGAV